MTKALDFSTVTRESWCQQIKTLDILGCDFQFRDFPNPDKFSAQCESRTKDIPDNLPEKTYPHKSFLPTLKTMYSLRASQSEDLMHGPSNSPGSGRRRQERHDPSYGISPQSLPRQGNTGAHTALQLAPKGIQTPGVCCMLVL